ncbi:protein casc4-like isoform X6 [Elysia marginata]|uniref:Protein casc4-like isoform X6 n=1 Tax=Elysia marginata TaxID=1093978 RepID=A0AAV4F2V5_9GAST|nr:protein casc4-like isoform X6 [Elysia marginata]
MTTNSRAAQRVPSRTPPFVLVGLLIILSFLGYSYYSLSSSNSDLSSQLEAIRVEKRDTDSQRSELEKTLTSIKSQATSLQSESNQLKRDIQAKDAEIQSLKADIAQKVADDEKQKSLLEHCDEKLSVVQKDLETSNAEKSNLQHTLDAEREKTTICGMEACQGPVHQILMVSSQLVGSAKMQEALAQAQLDANKLMNGINIPAPIDEKAQDKTRPDAASEKVVASKKDDFAQQAEDKKEPAKADSVQMEQPNGAGKNQADKVIEPPAQAIDQFSKNQYTRKVMSPALEALTTGAPDIEFDEAKHQGADGNESFPNDSMDDAQVEADNIGEEEVNGLGHHDRGNGINTQRFQGEDLGTLDLSITGDKTNFLQADRSEQLKAIDALTRGFRPDKEVSVGTGKSQEVLREAQEPQVVPYRTHLEDRQDWGDQRKPDFETGENMVRHFETVDKADLQK